MSKRYQESKCYLNIKPNIMTLQKKRKASKKYQNLSIIENEKKQQYSCEYYKNLSDNEKQKLVEYRKKKF